MKQFFNFITGRTRLIKALERRDKEVAQLLSALAQRESMTLDAYEIGALRTAAEDATPAEDLLHGCCGVVTEGGELLDVFKKHQFYGKPIDMVNVREEIGDVLWYLPVLCRASGTTLEAVAKRNLAKLRKRYPDKFSADKAINRDVVAEREVLENPLVKAFDDVMAERRALTELAKPVPPAGRVVEINMSAPMDAPPGAPRPPVVDVPAGDLLVVTKSPKP